MNDLTVKLANTVASLVPAAGSAAASGGCHKSCDVYPDDCGVVHNLYTEYNVCCTAAGVNCSAQKIGCC